VLTITEMLRKRGVVGQFVEFFGSGLDHLPLADRATIANMAPEFGSTCALFPVDEETLRYLRFSGRDAAQIELVEAYSKAQGWFRETSTPDPVFTDIMTLDLASVVPSVAGPRRPQDRVALTQVPESWRKALPSLLGPNASESGVAIPTELFGEKFGLQHGDVVIAAITSCTNTSNPSVMMAAGLLAKKAVARGLMVKPWVKTSLAPGSQVVTEYLAASGTLDALEQLRFNVVGYGCTTCIGNSGPLPEPVARSVEQGKLVVASVLSGNRNFEGRINPHVRANYLASPPLVVAYALAGKIGIAFESEPLGTDKQGKPVFLADVWPTPAEISEALASSVSSELFRRKYSEVYLGPEAWQRLPIPAGNRFEWDEASTYIRKPTFFEGLTREVPPLKDIVGARILALLGDSITTDHISPAGSIAKNSPAAEYLGSLGVLPRDFNSYGARRGNHEVMVRGTFANVRLRNQLVPGTEGGYTRYLPTGETTSIFAASASYQAEGIPLVVIAGKEYGTGSSRDWAAKGTFMLGVKAVIAESFERIHRSNLVGMGVLPLQFMAGENAASLGILGEEVFAIRGLGAGLAPGCHLDVVGTRADGSHVTFRVVARIDTAGELDYFRHGGILPYVLRQLL
jgi:aconitate hydratase